MQSHRPLARISARCPALQMLDYDLEDSEEQYQMAQRSHVLIVDKLIDLHKQKIKGIECAFERELQDVVDEFGTEHSAMSLAHAQHRKEMLDIMSLMEAGFNDAELDARQEFESAREEIKNKNSEDYQSLRFVLEQLIEELERHFDSAHVRLPATAPPTNRPHCQG